MKPATLPGVSTEFLTILSKRCPFPNIEPVTERDQWIWDAAQHDLYKQIEREAGQLKFDPTNIPKAAINNSSNTPSDSSTKNNTPTTHSQDLTKSTSYETSHDTYRPNVIVRLWRKVKAFFSQD